MNVVNDGKPCGFDLYGSSGRKHPASKGVITSPPKNGHAEFIGSRLQYTPSTGYVNTDEFSGKAWALSNSGVSRLMKVQIKVTVTGSQ